MRDQDEVAKAKESGVERKVGGAKVDEFGVVNIFSGDWCIYGF